MTGLAAEAVGKKTIMVDAIDLKAHHTVSSLRASSADQETLRWPRVPTIGGPASWLRIWAATPARRRGARRAMPALARRIAGILHRMWREDADFRLDLPVRHAGRKTRFQAAARRIAGLRGPHGAQLR